MFESLAHCSQIHFYLFYFSNISKAVFTLRIRREIPHVLNENARIFSEIIKKRMLLVQTSWLKFFIRQYIFAYLLIYTKDQGWTVCNFWVQTRDVSRSRWMVSAGYYRKYYPWREIVNLCHLIQRYKDITKIILEEILKCMLRFCYRWHIILMCLWKINMHLIIVDFTVIYELKAIITIIKIIY